MLEQRALIRLKGTERERNTGRMVGFDLPFPHITLAQVFLYPQCRASVTLLFHRPPHDTEQCVYRLIKYGPRHLNVLASVLTRIDTLQWRRQDTCTEFLTDGYRGFFTLLQEPTGGLEEARGVLTMHGRVVNTETGALTQVSHANDSAGVPVEVYTDKSIADCMRMAREAVYRQVATMRLYNEMAEPPRPLVVPTVERPVVTPAPAPAPAPAPRVTMPFDASTLLEIKRRIQKGYGKDRQCWHVSKQTMLIDGKQEPMKRVVWETKHGTLQKGARLMRTCDDPLCCNPDHYILRGKEATSAQ